MEWIEASIPYAIASVGFAMWPTTWLPVLAAVAFSTVRWRAALASGFLMLVFLAVMLPSGIFGPHLALANYGFVMLAGAVLAPALLLPRSVWPTGATAGPLVARPLWQAARDLHIVGTLAVLAIWFDRGLFYVAPDISDHQVAIYMVMLLAVAVLATRLTAAGTWTLVQRPLGRLPRVRRAVAAVGAIGFLSVAQLHLPMPLPLMAAGDLVASTDSNPWESSDCATITAHPEHGTLELWGAFCEDTPELFEDVHAAHPELRRIVLESGGGRGLVGLRLGTRLRELGFDARVDVACGSACVTAFVGARQRWFGPEARIAIHSGSLTVWAQGGNWVRWPMPPEEDIVAFQQEGGVAPGLELRAARTAPDDMDVLSPDDVVTYGIAQPATDAPWLPPPADAASSESQVSETP